MLLPARSTYAVASAGMVQKNGIRSAYERGPDDLPPVLTSGPVDGAEDRSAFTWRLTVDQANRLDELALRLRKSLGRAQLDRASMLWALVWLAEENPLFVRAIADRLREPPMR